VKHFLFLSGLFIISGSILDKMDPTSIGICSVVLFVGISWTLIEALIYRNSHKKEQDEKDR
jgi:hypothetical protein